ncbi:MAG: nucleotidyl transferase AbiEii/AbiGii toxin family protein, partial [Coriobacteriales bacterium]|nr:nucleotidyl transferase AbiEii/AbiGii toxin family protein [Coriobacteriales bacterium]
VVQSCKTPFYLTGGTALSRIYYAHRFSDDLDFFVNRCDETTASPK